MIGRNGVTNDAYISGGLGIGNATTTDGILETSGLGFIGGVLKVKGTSTSTFAGPVELTATSTMAGYKVCTAQNGTCTPIIVRKTVDEAVNNSTTLQDDDALFFSIGANETWEFTAHIGHDGGTATPDLKFAFTVPSGATLGWGCSGTRLDATDGLAQCAFIQTSGASEVFGGTNAGRGVFLTGIVANGATAGTVQFQWAQNTATVTNTNVLTSSYIMAWKKQ